MKLDNHNENVIECQKKFELHICFHSCPNLFVLFFKNLFFHLIVNLMAKIHGFLASGCGFNPL
jgi:hypothetical protein